VTFNFIGVTAAEQAAIIRQMIPPQRHDHPQDHLDTP